jgi:hypothetical protein
MMNKNNKYAIFKCLFLNHQIDHVWQLACSFAYSSVTMINDFKMLIRALSLYKRLTNFTGLINEVESPPS